MLPVVWLPPDLTTYGNMRSDVENIMRTRSAAMVIPLYAAHLSDLGPDDRVVVECGCGHSELLTPAMLATAGTIARHQDNWI
jgi:hypothetical protein